MDVVARELGERGKAVTVSRVAEGVPPALPMRSLEPAPAPTPAPALAQAHAQAQEQEQAQASAPPIEFAPTPAAVLQSPPDRDSTPSMQVSPPISTMQESMDATLLVQQLLEREEKAKAREDRLRREMCQEMEKMREEMKPAPPPTITSEQIAALQARLEVIHLAKLLSEDELDALEDTLLDYVEAKASSTTTSDEMHSAANKLSKLVAVSEAMTTDGVFARQARRRFL